MTSQDGLSKPHVYPMGNHHQQVYLRRAHKRQLTLSLLALCVSVGAILALPLTMLLVPAIARTEFFGLPLSFLLLVLAPFPLYLLVGGAYERRANALDAALTKIVDEDDV
jgi:putative solute:sodium symporter small subunit